MATKEDNARRAGELLLRCAAAAAGGETLATESVADAATELANNPDLLKSFVHHAAAGISWFASWVQTLTEFEENVDHVEALRCLDRRFEQHYARRHGSGGG